MTVRVRRATHDDVATIESVLVAAFGPLRELYTEAAYATTIRVDGSTTKWVAAGRTWVAEDNEDIVGTVSAQPGPAGALYLCSMAVLPEVRGRGVGSALLRSVMDHARSCAATKVWLSTSPFLEAAIRLYETHGFMRTSAPPHDLQGTPLFTMEYRLDDRS